MRLSGTVPGGKTMSQESSTRAMWWRWSFARQIGAVGVACVLGGLAACTPAAVPVATPSIAEPFATAPVRSPSPPVTTGPRTITIIRHGEKPNENDPAGPPFGVDVDGVQNPLSLVPRGWQRAHALAAMLKGDPVKAPFARPSVLYAPRFKSQEEERRTYQTLVPTASALGLTIQDPIGADHETDLASLALSDAGADVLICWEHNRIPDIVGPLASALGIADIPPVGRLWPDDDFSSALVFRLDAAGSGYVLVETDEGLLPGDPAAAS